MDRYVNSKKYIDVTNKKEHSTIYQAAEELIIRINNLPYLDSLQKSLINLHLSIPSIERTLEKFDELTPDSINLLSIIIRDSNEQIDDYNIPEVHLNPSTHHNIIITSPSSCGDSLVEDPSFFDRIVSIIRSTITYTRLLFNLQQEEHSRIYIDSQETCYGNENANSMAGETLHHINSIS